MKRKEFVAMGAGAFLLPSLTKGAEVSGTRASLLLNDRIYSGRLERLGGMTLQDLRDYHYSYLIDTYIPNWERGVDWQYGGFANILAPGNEPDFSVKRMYHQSRAVWVFSYLYNHITRDARHLEAAEKGRDFLVRHALDSGYRWRSFLDRQGEPQTGPLDHYGDIYMVLALTELYKATGREEDLEMAKKTAHSVMDRLVSPSYQHIEAHVTALEPGTRRLPSWQHFLNALTPLLRETSDTAIEKIAFYCVRVMIQHHWLPEQGVMLEILDDHFRPYTLDGSKWGVGTGDSHGAVSGWHSIQACWMIMDEALRVGHKPIYRQGVEMGLSTLEKTYAPGRGLGGMRNPGAGINPDGSFSWGALDDMLVYCLIAIEHSHEPQAIDYYNDCFALHNSRPENFVTRGLLHHPRRFFYTLNILDRMIERGGRVSGFFSS